MRRGLIAVLMVLTVSLFALDVAEDEIEGLAGEDVEFINYEGPYDFINTADEITAIGAELGQSVDGVFSDFVYSGKYRIVHAVDPDAVDGFDADIIMPLAGARVDHIDNIRRIITGFLVSAYDYQPSDAAVLARFITIYNAVVRGNMEFFEGRYKDVVTSYLATENAGLSRRYDEWPGKSRIVIPITDAAGPGVLGTVDPGELADDRVIEEMRSQEDMGVEDRRDLVDLSERVIDEQQDAIDREATAIAEEEARITAERDAIEQERADLANSDATDRDAREAELADREQQVRDDEAAVDARQEELAVDRQEVSELTSIVREEREQIARDTRLLLDESAISDEVRGLTGELSPIYFIQVRETPAAVLGQLVQINPLTGLTINRSAEDQIVSRSYTFMGNSLLVIVVEAESGRLALFDTATLEEITRGTDEIFLGSSLVVQGDPSSPEALAYAVVRAEGDWFVGRFSPEFELIDRSVLAVNPYTTFAFANNKLWVQTADDRIVSLGLKDLRVAP